MSNEYKEWLKEQTFESLANDNLRIKLELKTAKEENETITDKIAEIRETIPTEWFDKQHPSALSASVGSPYECICYIKDYVNTLTQQNKQMREALEKIASLLKVNNTIELIQSLAEIKSITEQALKGGE